MLSGPRPNPFESMISQMDQNATFMVIKNHHHTATNLMPERFSDTLIARFKMCTLSMAQPTPKGKKNSGISQDVGAYSAKTDMVW